jgi:hypothetical protein
MMEGTRGVAASPVGYAIAALPVGPPAGSIAFVTDQLTSPCAKGAAPVAGGAVRCLVFYNGAAWVGA